MSGPLRKGRHAHPPLRSPSSTSQVVLLAQIDLPGGGELSSPTPLQVFPPPLFSRLGAFGIRKTYSNEEEKIKIKNQFRIRALRATYNFDFDEISAPDHNPRRVTLPPSSPACQPAMCGMRSCDNARPLGHLVCRVLVRWVPSVDERLDCGVFRP